MAQDRPISVTAPISPAIDRVKLMLFNPFDLGKWFAVGFCAWLANWGSIKYFNFNSSSSHKGRHNDFNVSISGHEISQFKTMFTENWPMFWIIGSIVFVLLLAVTALILWISSRGKFMFLYDVARNEDKVSKPWSDYKTQGNSLFWFRFAVIAIASVSAIMLSFFIAPMMIIMNRGSKWGILGFAFSISILALVSLVTLLVLKFNNDFITQIMYHDKVRCLQAWRRFSRLLSNYPGDLVLYILFQIVIFLVMFIIVSTITVLACCFCCIGILLFLPYLGTVALLPIHVFLRAYSIYYLKQFGDDYNVFYFPAEQEPQLSYEI